MVLEIGENIKYTDSKGVSRVSVVSGRNWSYDTLLSYIVKVDGSSITINANSMKSEFSV